MVLPLESKLALAPIDDEPVTPQEAAEIEAGLTSLKATGGNSMEEVLADFGLTLEDFRKMGETPLPNESQRMIRRVIWCDEARADIRRFDPETALRLLKVQ